MLQQLNIKNYQSHEDTTLDFHEGINAIIGNSNAGKSAILRTVRWVIDNAPSVDSKNNRNNRDKRGDPINPIEASLSFDDMVIKRIKSKTRNGYDFGDTSFNAIGTNVPDEITAFLNLSEVNNSRQHDAKFLLTNSSGEVARYLNSILKLDKIDTTLSRADEHKRAITKEKEANKTEVEAIDKELQSFSEIEKYAILLSSYDYLKKQADELTAKATVLIKASLGIKQIESTIDSNRAIYERSTPLIQGYRVITGNLLDNTAILKKYMNSKESIEVAQELLCNVELLSKAKVLIKEYKENREKYSKISNKITELCYNQEIVNKCLVTLKKGEQLQYYKDLIARMEEIVADMKEQCILHGELHVMKGKIMLGQKEIVEKSVEIDRLKELLPEICPLCGKRIGECDE
jgi:exonuclease SbcC